MLYLEHFRVANRDGILTRFDTALLIKEVEILYQALEEVRVELGSFWAPRAILNQTRMYLAEDVRSLHREIDSLVALVERLRGAVPEKLFEVERRTRGPKVRTP